MRVLIIILLEIETMPHPILKDSLVFTTTIEIKRERIDDLLTSALEGGCNYWLALHADDIHKEGDKLNGELCIERQLMLGGTLHCYDRETGDKLGEFTIVKLVGALQAMAKGEDLDGKKNDHLKWHFNNFATENDDAETADVAFQIATMGSIVFS